MRRVAASKVTCGILGDFEAELKTQDSPFHPPLPELASELLWPASTNLLVLSTFVFVGLFGGRSVRSESEARC